MRICTREGGRDEETHSLSSLVIHKPLILAQPYKVYIIRVRERVVRDIIQLVRNTS